MKVKSIKFKVASFRFRVLGAALLSASALVAAESGETQKDDSSQGSAFGLWATPLKIKGTPEELAKQKAKYDKSHGAAAMSADQKARARRNNKWDLRPKYSPKKDAELIAFAEKVVAAAKVSPDEAAFRKTVEGLAAGKEGIELYNLLRGASHYLFYEVKEKPGEVWKVKALDRMVWDMKWPEERVSYTVKFDRNAPRTAEGALLAGYFKSGTDDRFAPSRTYSTLNKKRELISLKANPQPSIHANEPGHELAFKAVYDMTGVHFYLKCNDPEAWRTKQGMADGAHFELTVLPGEGASEWYQTFMSAADPTDRVQIEWGQPWVGRPLSRDYMRNDSFVGEDCYVFHSFFPWILFTRQLPSDGTVWRGVISGSWGSAKGTFGGGKSHELGRGPRYVFEVTDEAAARMREGVVRQAVGAYRKVREDWAEVGFWEDVHLGDPAFYRDVVLPYIHELDIPASKVVRLTATPEDYAAFYEKYVDAWASFRMMLNRKRAEYLEAKMFKED